MPNKPKKNQYRDYNVVQGRDLFKTPRYATELLIPFIPKDIVTIWECAAGEGNITRVLDEYGYKVKSTDINNVYENYNFVLDDDPPFYDCIITNPPFSLKRIFFDICLSLRKPFALLIPADYSTWIIEAIRDYGCEKIIPTRRIDYITPNGNIGKNSASQFHSMWLTRYFGLGKTETFVELSLKDKKERIL